ncbi:MAG TPA: ATP phosphoribosyltransferase regulatory subunit [Thermoanaerobaculia bacterium]|nr:ATP phosphoribosyltransferase regulatory subunit [Thermoanaerobaculia bacterium]
MTTPLKSYPTGVRALLVEEAARRRRIESRFVAELERAAFAEIVLPIIDYVEPYAALVDKQLARQSYRFVDRDGELVTIRSDFTPMVARALAPSLRVSDLPLKIFYRGDVIRCEASRLGVNRELFQIGAEILGDDSVEADAGALLLSTAIIAGFGIRPMVVYNDVSIVERIIAFASASTGASPDIDRAIRSALVAKRTGELAAVRASIPPAALALIEQLASGEATLASLANFEATADAARRLESIERATRDAANGDFILHLDDIDESPGYYTGLRFRIYDAGTRSRIAQGGRYDSLYQRFGFPAAAIGFTFTIDDLDERELNATTATAQTGEAR